MSELNLVPADADVLWRPAETVVEIEQDVLPHVERMLALMRKNGGIGLAAPQVGLGLRFFVTDCSPALRVVINPVITYRSPVKVARPEGCLTFPGRRIPKSRATCIEASWFDAQGEWQSARISGMQARVFQHEFDHLDGVCLFPRPQPVGQEVAA